MPRRKNAHVDSLNNLVSTKNTKLKRVILVLCLSDPSISEGEDKVN